MSEKGDHTDTGPEFNLELFFEMSPDLLCVAGYDGYFKKINPTVSKTLGYTNEELFARPINSFVHPDDQGITEQNRDNLRNDNPLLYFENRYVTKSGGIVWLSWTSTPIKSQQLVFAIAKNITHKKKQDEDRNKMLANLTAANQNLKQLTYTTSHDLRLPVNNLLAIFDFLDVSKIRDAETLEFINMLHHATESLRDVMNNYIDALSKKNVLQVAVEEVQISECLNDVLHGLNSLIQGSKANITSDLSAFASVRFNKLYMESVLLNLIANAIKYSRPNHPPVIGIITQINKGVKQLIFTDEGLGFDMEKAKGKVFGFSQKFHDHADSKGIGLYLVYNHITSLGGQIAIESEVNKGTKFTISFKD